MKTQIQLIADEFKSYIEKNGITLATRTKDFCDIPKDQLLYFGLWKGSISTFDSETENKNKEFSLNIFIIIYGMITKESLL